MKPILTVCAAAMSAAILPAESSAQIRQICGSHTSRAKACTMSFVKNRSAVRSARIRTGGGGTRWYKIQPGGLGEVQVQVLKPGGVSRKSRIKLFKRNSTKAARNLLGKLGKLGLGFPITPYPHFVSVSASPPYLIKVTYTAKRVRGMICRVDGGSRSRPCLIRSAPRRKIAGGRKKVRGQTGPHSWTRSVGGHLMVWDRPDHWYLIRVTKAGELRVHLTPSANFFYRYYYFEIGAAANDQLSRRSATNSVYGRILQVQPGDYLVRFGIQPGIRRQWPDVHLAYTLQIDMKAR